jgi:hypothetical protein
MKIVIQFILLTSLLMMLIRCSSSISNEELEGGWGYFNYSDTTYDEIYFTKEFLVHNFSSIGIRGVDAYLLLHDTVYLMPGKVYYFHILKNQKDKLLIRNLDGIELSMEKLDMPNEPFLAFCISEARRIDLQKGRIFRGAEFLLKNRLKTSEGADQDSIILVPTFEK